MASPVYRSLDQSAEYLGSTSRTLRRYIATGQLPAFRMGKRQIRVRTADLDKLLQPIPVGGESRDDTTT